LNIIPPPAVLLILTPLSAHRSNTAIVVAIIRPVGRARNVLRKVSYLATCPVAEDPDTIRSAELVERVTTRLKVNGLACGPVGERCRDGGNA